jgi:LAS superfamily LD-carboxypeptidase LdcB
MVRYRLFDGKPVSIAWHRVLTRARKKGVKFTVTSGHRTFVQQRYLYEGWRAGRPGFNLAAKPSHSAPHIRTGRPDHAIDFGPDPESVQRLLKFLNSRALRGRLTVPGEWWHVEVEPGRLTNLARRILARFR